MSACSRACAVRLCARCCRLACARHKCSCVCTRARVCLRVCAYVRAVLSWHEVRPTVVAQRGAEGCDPLLESLQRLRPAHIRHTVSRSETVAEPASTVQTNAGGALLPATVRVRAFAGPPPHARMHTHMNTHTQPALQRMLLLRAHSSAASLGLSTLWKMRSR